MPCSECTSSRWAARKGIWCLLPILFIITEAKVVARAQQPKVVVSLGKEEGGGKGSKATYEGNGSWPKGGLGYKSNDGPWVPCQNARCKGHNGNPSFKYISSIGVGVNGDYCMACGQGWKKSLQQAKTKGIIPGECGVEDDITEGIPKNSRSPVTAEEPGTGNFEATRRTPFQPTIPKAALDVCPPSFIGMLHDHFERGLDADILKCIQHWAIEGKDDAKKFNEAVAIASAAKGSPIQPLAPSPTLGATSGKTPEQLYKASKAAWNTSHAELLQKEKALEAGNRDVKWYNEKV